MAAKHLTARFCASATPGKGPDGKARQTAFPDDDPKGLELRVSAEGRKVWCFRYRTLDGTQRRLTLGVFAPGEDDDGSDVEGSARPLTLRAARRKARQARAVAESGGDPASEKRRAKAAARAQSLRTFDDLADAYLRACEAGEWKPKGRQKRDRTIGDERKMLARYVRPQLGREAVEGVDRAAVRRVLRGMAARGIGAQTNRTHAVIRQVFAWAIAEERLDANPAVGFAKLATESPRARVASDAELAGLWSVLSSPAGRLVRVKGAEPRPLYLSRPMAIILQLSALLLQRRSEIAGMRLSEVDLAQGVWTIPADRMKGARAHLVPLPPRAVELIREAMTLAAAGREKPPLCVFPGARNPERPMTGDAVSHAFADVQAACGLEGLRVHDLRRTGASAMASERIAVAPFVVSRVLGHTADTGGAAAVTLHHYAVYDYAAEKRRALEAWESLLLEIVGERPRATNVVKLVEAR